MKDTINWAKFKDATENDALRRIDPDEEQLNKLTQSEVLEINTTVEKIIELNKILLKYAGKDKLGLY